MYFGAIQICGERVGSSETKDFCDALAAHKIKLLSLRECGIATKNFKKLMESLGGCKSILHLNLNLCGIHCEDRIGMLTSALCQNKSLTALLLHGNHFGTEGVTKIVRPLILHPGISCLDVGDCDIGDKGLKIICELLPPDGNKPGLQELVLSGNPRITCRAWEKFSVSVSACSTLRSLYIDFNNIGESAGKMLVVCAAGHKSLNVLDMEACDLSENVARLLLHLLQHFPTTLSHVLLEENGICDETKYAIRVALGESESDLSSSDDDMRCELKPRQCKPQQRKRRRQKHCIVSSSDEEEEEVVVDCWKPAALSCTEVKKSGTDCNRKTEYRCRAQTKASTHGDKCKKSNITCERQCVRSAVSCHEPSASEQTVAKLKIKLAEASESTEGELLQPKEDVNVTCEFKADEISQSSSKYHKQVVHIRGGCDGGVVNVRLRSKSRDACPDACPDTPSSTLRCAKSRVRKSCPEMTTICCEKKQETNSCTRKRLQKKSRSRTRRSCGKMKSFRHRGSLGLASAELWSDDDGKPDGCNKTKKDGCGRGPWCGRGPLRLPPRPLERMSNIDDNSQEVPVRHSALQRRSTGANPRVNPDFGERTDNDISEIIPDHVINKNIHKDDTKKNSDADTGKTSNVNKMTKSPAIEISTVETPPTGTKESLQRKKSSVAQETKQFFDGLTEKERKAKERLASSGERKNSDRLKPVRQSRERERSRSQRQSGDKASNDRKTSAGKTQRRDERSRSQSRKPRGSGGRSKEKPERSEKRESRSEKRRKRTKSGGDEEYDIMVRTSAARPRGVISSLKRFLLGDDVVEKRVSLAKTDEDYDLTRHIDHASSSRRSSSRKRS